MKTIASFRFLHRPLLLALAVAAGACSLPAAEPTPPERRLVIAKGTFTGGAPNARPTPATLGNLADELMRRYPTITVNIVGVESVAFTDLTLRWPVQTADQQEEAAVAAILRALQEAAGERAFTLDRPSLNQFLLSNPRARGNSPASRRIDVFNLKTYMRGTGDKAAWEMELRQGELQLRALNANYERAKAQASTGQRPSSEADAFKNELQIMQERLTLVDKKVRRANPTAQEISTRLNQLIEVVRSTLAKFNPAEKAPEFEYHDGSHLLIVIGSDEAIDVTRKVVTALEKSSD